MCCAMNSNNLLTAKRKDFFFLSIQIPHLYMVMVNELLSVRKNTDKFDSVHYKDKWREHLNPSSLFHPDNSL